MFNSVAFLISADNNINIVIDGKSHLIQSDHLNYDKIRTALVEERFDDLNDLLNVAQSIENSMTGIQIVNSSVLYNGEPLHGLIVERILQFYRQNLPFKHLTKFLENLMANPSRRAVTELYSFLEHGGFPITPDGCFIGYKGVGANYKDKHTGTIDNSVGAKPSRMERNQVCDDANKSCSTGYHVGTLEYASDWAGESGHVMLVKVNPADAVSVPHDSSCQKLRVAYYEVVAETNERRIPIAEPLYTLSSLDEEEEEEITIAYKQGETAFAKNIPQSFNPYAASELPESDNMADILVDSWDNGWQDAADLYASTGGSNDNEVEVKVEPATGRIRGLLGRFLPFSKNS